METNQFRLIREITKIMVRRDTLSVFILIWFWQLENQSRIVRNVDATRRHFRGNSLEMLTFRILQCAM